jgi:hypothetical protein
MPLKLRKMTPVSAQETAVRISMTAAQRRLLAARVNRLPQAHPRSAAAAAASPRAAVGLVVTVAHLLQAAAATEVASASNSTWRHLASQ